MDNPYPWYSSMRELSPIHKITNGQILVTGHKYAKFLLTHPACSHWGQNSDTQAFMSTIQKEIAKTLYSLSIESGKPYRKTIMHKMAARSLKIREEEIHETAQSILDGLKNQTAIEFMHDYAHKFTFTTIAKVIGVPDSKIKKISDVAGKMGGAYLDCIIGESDTSLGQEFIELLSDFLTEKRKSKDDKLASLLIELCEEEDEEEEFIISLIILLFYAGHENMMNFMGNSIIALNNHKDFQQSLRDDPKIISSVVHELLRYDSPLQFIMLLSEDRIKIDEYEIPPGNQLLVSVAAANRDPLVFEDPDNLILDRKGEYLSFGAGSFRCIGARLAQIQAEIGLSLFLKNIKEFEIISEDLIWNESTFVQRGPKHLPLKLTWHE